LKDQCSSASAAVASSCATNLLGGVVFEPHSPIFLELTVAS
jgi:hypothetical protein